MVSEIIPVFSRKVIFGYPMVVAASIAIGFLAMTVPGPTTFRGWHGRPPEFRLRGVTMLIAIPTGIKIFNWVATMYGGRIRFATPMLFACAFLFSSSAPASPASSSRWCPSTGSSRLHFVVAHFHFVLVGSLIFTIFGAIYYWFPKAPAAS